MTIWRACQEANGIDVENILFINYFIKIDGFAKRGMAS
jgi:hypothetical protein